MQDGHVEDGTHDGNSNNDDDALRRVGDRLGDGARLLDGHGRELVVAVEPKPCHAARVSIQSSRTLFFGRSHPACVLHRARARACWWGVCEHMGT